MIFGAGEGMARGAQRLAARDERRLDRMHNDARAVLPVLLDHNPVTDDAAKYAWDIAEAMDAERAQRRAKLEAGK